MMSASRESGAGGLSPTSQLQRVLQDTTELVIEAMDCERATVYLVRDSSRELESVAVTGPVVETIRVPVSNRSLAGYCALTCRSYIVPDAYGDLGWLDPELSFDRSWDEANRFRTRDVMCAPCRCRERVAGVAQVMNCRDGVFRSTDLVRFETVANLVGYALHYASLAERLLAGSQAPRRA